MLTFDGVREVLVEQLAVKPEVVKLESRLVEDLGADSLDVAEIVSALEEKFQININEEEAKKITFIGDVVELINQKFQVVKVVDPP